VASATLSGGAADRLRERDPERMGARPGAFVDDRGALVEEGVDDEPAAGQPERAGEHVVGGLVTRRLRDDVDAGRQLGRCLRVGEGAIRGARRDELDPLAVADGEEGALVAGGDRLELVRAADDAQRRVTPAAGGLAGDGTAQRGVGEQRVEALAVAAALGIGDLPVGDRRRPAA
jgi:hypothetical protein